MTSLPRISVVTPCFNHERFIAATIASVQSQDYPNLEYIVVNDGSTDNSLSKIHASVNGDTAVISMEGHRDSPVEAINAGFAQATGDVFFWLSSDDVLMPGALRTIGEIFGKHDRVSWLTGLATTIDVHGRIVNCRLRKKHKFDFLSGDWKVIQQESTFFRRRLWEEAGGGLNVEYTQAFDTELWTRFFNLAELHLVNTPLGAFRKGDQSRSTRNQQEFLYWNNRALTAMRFRSSRRSVYLASIWKILQSRPLKPVFCSLPDRIYKKLFPFFTYPLFTYSFSEDKWNLQQIR